VGVFYGLLVVAGIWVCIALGIYRCSIEPKPQAVICQELAEVPHEPGALAEWLGPKTLKEYPHSAVLDCLWVYDKDRS
jgi:hypothetical protein